MLNHSLFMILLCVGKFIFLSDILAMNLMVQWWLFVSNTVFLALPSLKITHGGYEPSDSDVALAMLH